MKKINKPTESSKTTLLTIRAGFNIWSQQVRPKSLMQNLSDGKFFQRDRIKTKQSDQSFHI